MGTSSSAGTSLEPQRPPGQCLQLGGDFRGSSRPPGPSLEHWHSVVPIAPSRWESQLRLAWRDVPMSPSLPGSRSLAPPSPTSSLSSRRRPDSTDGSVLSCSHVAPTHHRWVPAVPHVPHPTGDGPGPGAAVVGVTPSLRPAHSALPPLGLAPASAGVSRDPSIFLSRNTGFLVKSCSSVAVTTLLQFPSRDVFLCCDRDAGRRPPAIGVRSGDGEGLPPRRAGTRCCPRGDLVGLRLWPGAGGVPMASSQPWLGPGHPGDSGGARSRVT